MRTYVFIDASNLFYGGRKSLGWSIDHEKLALYFKSKYEANKVYYFGGVEIHDFPFDYIKNETVPINDVSIYLVDFIEKNKYNLSDVIITLINRYLKRIRFYMKLEKFGYILVLKPVKTHVDGKGISQKKANCDVDMTLYLIRYKDDYDRALVLTGDGDFLSALKYLRDNNKEVLVLARSPRTAKEIKKFAGDKFLDFEFLREIIRMDE
ncbi:MAG: NYN domain-containing protein [bacterium]